MVTELFYVSILPVKVNLMFAVNYRSGHMKNHISDIYVGITYAHCIDEIKVQKG